MEFLGSDDGAPVSWVPSDTGTSDTSFTAKIPTLMEELLRGEELRSSKSRYLRKNKQKIKLKRHQDSVYHPEKITKAAKIKKHQDLSSSNIMEPNKSASLRKRSNIEVIEMPLMYPNTSKIAELISSKSRNNKREYCPLRIMELAEPTKRQCLETWKNKKDILPAFMIERLKNIVLEQKPVATIPDAITCFNIKRPLRHKSKYKPVFKIRTKEDAEQLRLMCAQFSLAIAKKFEKPCTLNLPREQKILSSVVAQSIAQIMTRKKIDNNKVEYRKILEDVSDRITMWIATILEDVKNIILEEELEELREKEGPVYDILDDIVEDALNICVIENDEASQRTSNDTIESIPHDKDGNDEVLSKTSDNKLPQAGEELAESEQNDENAKQEEDNDEVSKPLENTEEPTDREQDVDVKNVEFDDEVSSVLDASRTGENERKVKFSPIDSGIIKSENVVVSSSSKNNLDNIVFNPPKEELLSDADESWPTDMVYPIFKVSESAGKSIESLGNIEELTKDTNVHNFDNPLDLENENLITNVEFLSQQDKNNVYNNNPQKDDQLILIMPFNDNKQVDFETSRAQIANPIEKIYNDITTQTNEIDNLVTNYTQSDNYKQAATDKRDAATNKLLEITEAQKPVLNLDTKLVNETTLTGDSPDLISNSTQVDKNKQIVDNDVALQNSQGKTATQPTSDQKEYDLALRDWLEKTGFKYTKQPKNDQEEYDMALRKWLEQTGFEYTKQPTSDKEQCHMNLIDGLEKRGFKYKKQPIRDQEEHDMALRDWLEITGFKYTKQPANNQEEYDLALRDWLEKTALNYTKHPTSDQEKNDNNMALQALIEQIGFDYTQHRDPKEYYVALQNAAEKTGFLSVSRVFGADGKYQNYLSAISNLTVNEIDTDDSNESRISISNLNTNMSGRYDYKVYEETAPSWVGRGRGDQCEDLYQKVKQQISEKDIQQWCKNLKNVLTLLEKWNNWIITVAENYITLKKKIENCRCHHKRCPKHMKRWAKLRDNINKDLLLWTKLQKKAITKLQKSNDIINSKNQLRRRCRCAEQTNK